ncbi:hypothetical protein NITHO_460022 [Nitrolancea hollandica Lb]|uniref:Uncharacterized protein n=1 Tax=Nitrolancea hollandica Lb TaxID=1129897 RepID=I4EKH4_9BACT|nr:hypothetical protein NITHO_460022 [Nitrolancea hollandica Lb]
MARRPRLLQRLEQIPANISGVRAASEEMYDKRSVHKRIYGTCFCDNLLRSTANPEYSFVLAERRGEHKLIRRLSSRYANAPPQGRQAM